jgi:anti-sigma B factor antagonist
VSDFETALKNQLSALRTRHLPPRSIAFGAAGEIDASGKEGWAKERERPGAIYGLPLKPDEMKALVRSLGIPSGNVEKLFENIRFSDPKPSKSPAKDSIPVKNKEFMSSQPRRHLEVEHIGDVTVVNFVDRKILDDQIIKVIGDQLFGLVDNEGLRKLLLNFGNVEYLSSAALGKLITLNKKLQAAGGRLILCNIDPQVYEVFEIIKLDKFFNIQKEEQTALQAF